jgi:hypothetical protein
MSKRSQRPQTSPRIPSWSNPGPQIPEREDTVLQGHPEVAGQFTHDYDARDPELRGESRRMDMNYVSPEERRLKAKYGRGW